MKFGLISTRSLALLSAACIPLAAEAGQIGVNYGSASQAILPSDSAGVPIYAQINWNNVSTAASGLLLNDDTATATTAALTTTNAGFSLFTSNFNGTDERLNNGRANTISGTSWSFSLANIPYAAYSIVVYDLQFTVNQQISINCAGTTYYTASPLYNAAGYIDNNPSTGFTYLQGTSTTLGSPTPDSDYVVFTGLSGGSQTVTMQTITNTGARIGGFQIIETVPEPATLSITTLGIAAMIRRRRTVQR